MISAGDPYFRADLALVHERGFAFHADGCAPGILDLLDPVRRRDGTVLELGAGSGHLTRHLVAAGHRVIATDASPAMLDLLRDNVADVEQVRRITVPDDPLPPADAIVSVGHALSYLPDEAAIERAWHAIAEALRPGGVLAIDICDLRWGEVRTEQGSAGWTGEDWALITRFSLPARNRYVRDMVIFRDNGDGTWRRDEERHDNVLVDTSTIPPRLAEHGITASLHDRVGDYRLPDGLVAVIGHRPDA